MRNVIWQSLLRHIPTHLQDQYMLVTSSGTEIALQSFLRIEAEFVVVKGRLAGSQEQGRIFFLPYANIDYVGTSQPTKDSDFHEQFSNLVLPAYETAPPVADLPASGAARERSESPSHHEGSPAVSPSANDSRPRVAIRSEVLERFRSRTNGPASSGNLPRPNGL